MQDPADVAADAQVRRRLLGVAVRVLGSSADAEDAVQEALLRWYRLSQAERDAVDVPLAWLTTVVSRVCLDVLGSARHRREAYVGEWLPEPLPHDAVAGSALVLDPPEQAVWDESVHTAVQVVLDALTPAARVSYVLHDVFAVPFAEVAEVTGSTPEAARQLAASARRDVAARRRRASPAAEHRRLVDALVLACRTGDVASLAALLADDVVAVSDGGGRVSAARRPVRGADRVLRFLAGILAKRPGLVLEPAEVSGRPGVVLRDSSALVGVASVEVVDGRASELWLVMNPDKLRLWS
ncbi:RNA polymerase sigma factor SigJ [Aeromicrobium endophyticum]|uniref:RNA polymerase sigma factor SigJ n=1 Tax=Aeromicrobium endophyticum TaxID=2292704 RepID=A0A371PDG6_9ACTN|nr:RNA polymerase sigma factor SigJ [Aeromicrobium endophyticum]